MKSDLSALLFKPYMVLTMSAGMLPLYPESKSRIMLTLSCVGPFRYVLLMALANILLSVNIVVRNVRRTLSVETTIEFTSSFGRSLRYLPCYWTVFYTYVHHFCINNRTNFNRITVIKSKHTHNIFISFSIISTHKVLPLTISNCVACAAFLGIFFLTHMFF